MKRSQWRCESAVAAGCIPFNWSMGSGATSPPIQKFGSAHVFEAASDGEQGVGVRFRPVVAPVALRAPSLGEDWRQRSIKCSKKYWNRYRMGGMRDGTRREIDSEMGNCIFSNAVKRMDKRHRWVESSYMKRYGGPRPRGRSRINRPTRQIHPNANYVKVIQRIE